MERPKPNWQTFVGRRKLNVSEWLKNNGIESFSQLEIKCKSMNMIPPSKSEVSQYFPKKPRKKERSILEEKIEEEVFEMDKSILQSLKETEEYAPKKKPGRKRKKSLDKDTTEE